MWSQVRRLNRSNETKEFCPDEKIKTDTREQAAKKLDLKQRMVQYLEKGKRTDKDFEKIPETTQVVCFLIEVSDIILAHSHLTVTRNNAPKD